MADYDAEEKRGGFMTLKESRKKIFKRLFEWKKRCNITDTEIKEFFDDLEQWTNAIISVTIDETAHKIEEKLKEAVE